VGKVQSEPLVKPICGALFIDPMVLEQAWVALEEMLGPRQDTSEPVAFTYSTYYDAEMGPGIRRCYASFASPVDAGFLASAKHATNRIERTLAQPDGRRRVNLDIGYLGAGQVVLATTKGVSHRVAIGRGIYGELTYTFAEGEYRPLPWTYPDYRDEGTRSFFLQVRSDYMRQHQAWSSSPGARHFTRRRESA